MNRNALGAKLKTIREKRNLSQEDLGEIVGSRQSTISDIENGRRLPSVKMLFALSEALDVTLNDLASLDPQSTKPTVAELA